MNETQYAAEIKALAEALQRFPTQKEWSREFGHCHKTLRPFGGFAAVRERALFGEREYDAPDLPDEHVPVETLIEQRKQAFQQRQRYEDAHHLIPFAWKNNLPLALVLLGDIHVDNDGTDLITLAHDLRLTDATPGMHASFLGDFRDNWPGTLARLYADQSTSASDAVRMMEHYISLTDWLFITGGNHDLWSGADDPIPWIMRQRGGVYAETRVRIALQFPNGREVRVNARHDFRGNSQWNPAHAVMKAAQMGWRDHLLVCGHKHKSGYGAIKDPNCGIISHAVQVASYKIYDDYAAKQNFPDQNIAPSVAAIINPAAQRETGLVQIMFDLEAAADYVTFLRRRAA